jgi:hypothetical protein
MSKIKKIRNEKASEKKKHGAKEIKREPFRPLQVLLWEDYLSAIILSALTLFAYAYTAAPGITLEDSGDFIMGVLTLGIVHPPGYPLYTVLGHLFSLLPLGDAAYRVNLFSALWGSLCLGVVFLILRMLSIERLHAVFATLFLGFTTVYWSKAVIAEVYSLNGFLIACITFWIFTYNRDKKKSQLYLIFLTTGLALSNHYPLVILTGLGLFFLLDRSDLQIRDFAKGFLFLVLGLTPYLYLFIQAMNPEVQYNFGKLTDLGMVFDHLSRKYYLNEAGGTWWDKSILTFTVLRAIVTDFFFASLLLIFGITICFVEKWNSRYPLLLAALSPFLGLIILLTFRSEDEHKTLLLDFLIPTFLFLSIFMSIGLKTFMVRYVKNKMVQVCLLLILFVTQVGFNFGNSTRHNDKLAEVWGTELLSSLEPKSILILCGGGQFQFPLYYQQLIKGVRQDVTIYDRHSAFTKDNLYGPGLLFRRSDGSKYREIRERQLIQNSLRPIYYTCKDVFDEQNIDLSLTPFVYRADNRHSEASDFTKHTVSDVLLDSLLNGYPRTELWSDQLKKITFNRLITYYGAHHHPEVNKIHDYFKRTKLYSDTDINLSIANNLYYFRNFELAGLFYERGAELSVEAFSATDLAVFCDVLVRARNYEKALPICMRQEQISAPCKANTLATQQTIATIYKEQGNWSKVADYSRKIIRCQQNHKTARRYLEMASERAQ